MTLGDAHDRTHDRGTRGPRDPRRAALEQLSLAELEEVGGELQRRLGVALRRIGERDADMPGPASPSPRRQTAQLAVESEVVALALGALAAGLPAGARVPGGHPTLAAAIAYAAPNLSALLTRLEQDRRLLTSLARQLESRLDAEFDFGGVRETPRQLLIEVLVESPARIALALERSLETREL